MKKILALLFSFFMLLPLASCTDGSDNRISVITSFYPVYIFTKNLTHGIDGISVKNMTEQSVGCLHDYALLSKDMKALGKCDAFVINGAGMESFMQKALEQIKDLYVIDSSSGVAFIENDGGKGVNAHIWLDASNAIAQVKNISTGLQRAFPQYAQKIAENESGYIERLKAVDADIRGILSDCKGAKIISFHEAYEYFARAYSLQVLASIETDDGAEPSARELSELVKIIGENNVKALFIEPTYQGGAAEILKRETGVQIYTLNPITNGEDSLEAYEEIMRSNAAVIKKALGDAY